MVKGFSAKELPYYPEELRFEDCLKLKHGDIVHETFCFNSNRTCRRWRVTGKVRTWKKDPSRIEVPVRHGLYVNGTIRESNLNLFHLPNHCTNPNKE